ncbi:MAG: hypothetical protein ACD_29C00478G0008 [uncultured bacterium]|nr:MAG: hypothetical protein ACD_29C00478G0008 [uncultured bacterium]
MPGPVIQSNHQQDNQVAPKRSYPWYYMPVSASFGGSTGAYINFIFEGLKKKAQSGQIYSFHPRELYRGSVAFSGSVTLATVVQMSFNAFFKSIPGYDQTSVAWNTGSAIASGTLGALVGSTPVENIILTQQLNQVGPYKAVKLMLKQSITRPWVGYPELAMREAGFALTMLYGADAARQYVVKITGNEKQGFAAEIVFSLVGAGFTHPFDRVATYKQKHNGTLSTRQAWSEVFANEGLHGFFKGYQHRAFLFTGCAITIPKLTNIARDYLETGKTPKLPSSLGFFGKAKQKPIIEEVVDEKKDNYNRDPSHCIAKK